MCGSFPACHRSFVTAQCWRVCGQTPRAYIFLTDNAVSADCGKLLTWLTEALQASGFFVSRLQPTVNCAGTIAMHPASFPKTQKQLIAPIATLTLPQVGLRCKHSNRYATIMVRLTKWSAAQGLIARHGANCGLPSPVNLSRVGVGADNG